MEKNIEEAAKENLLVKEILSLYDFKILKKGKHVELYYMDYDDKEGRIVLRVLNDNKTIRLSVTEPDDFDLYHEVDLFEFTEIEKLHSFMNLIQGNNHPSLDTDKKGMESDFEKFAKEAIAENERIHEIIENVNDPTYSALIAQLKKAEQEIYRQREELEKYQSK